MYSGLTQIYFATSNYAKKYLPQTEDEFIHMFQNISGI